MVLQDVETTADSFTDNPYPSENDPSPPSARRYDPSTLPQPLPILGPFLGFSEWGVRFKVESTLKFAEYRVGRPLTPEESQALATHLHTLEQTKSYVAAAGFGLGVWRWYTTMNKNRYPFYQPKPESIDPNKFAFIKGPRAQLARHSWRFVLYYVVASRVGSVLGQVIAQPVAAQNTAKDPKLAQFSADLKASVAADPNRAPGAQAQGAREQFSRELAKAKEHTARGPLERGRRGETSLPESQPRESWNIQKPTPVDDDMSPTAGNDPWPAASSDTWADADSSYDSTQKPQPRQRSAPSSNAWGRPFPRPAEDDASPTGGMFQGEVRSQSKPGESAWERLRRGDAPPEQQRPPLGRPQPPHREQREGSTLGDAFTFAGEEDERNRAQERAQREFDARLERERQGREERRW